MVMEMNNQNKLVTDNIKSGGALNKVHQGLSRAYWTMDKLPDV